MRNVLCALNVARLLIANGKITSGEDSLRNQKPVDVIRGATILSAGICKAADSANIGIQRKAKLRSETNSMSPLAGA